MDASTILAFLERHVMVSGTFVAPGALEASEIVSTLCLGLI